MKPPSKIAGLILSVTLPLVLTGFSATQPVSQPTSAELDPLLRAADSSAIVRAILTFDHDPTEAEVAQVQASGLAVHTFDALPMIAVQGRKADIMERVTMTGLRSIFLDRQLEYFLADSVEYIDAPQVYDDVRLGRGTGVTGEGVTVAVIDTGIDGTHPDLHYDPLDNDAAGEVLVQNVKVLPENVFTDEPIVAENVINTDTNSGHGTHVAGIIAGRGTASDGKYHGVAPGAQLVGIGAGDALAMITALQGFDYAISNRQEYNIRVISNSWGTKGEFDPDDPVNVASKEAHDKGIVVIFAAGNIRSEDVFTGRENNLNPYAVAPWVIGVTAGCTTQTHYLMELELCEPGGSAPVSAWGIPGDDIYHPTITAPGFFIASSRASTGIYATVGTIDHASCQPTDPAHYLRYVCASGTSQAAPHVSGVVALMLETNPTLSPDQVKAALIETARTMEGYQEYQVGAGYVDADDAVWCAKIQCFQ